MLQIPAAFTVMLLLLSRIAALDYITAFLR